MDAQEFSGVLHPIKRLSDQSFWQSGVANNHITSEYLIIAEKCFSLQCDLWYIIGQRYKTAGKIFAMVFQIFIGLND